MKTMAQLIKKLQDGGSPTNKYGTYTDARGTTYQVDDEFLKQLGSYGASLGGDVGSKFTKIVDALKRGENLSYDGTSLTGNVDFNVNRRQQRHLNKGKGPDNFAKQAIRALSGFQYAHPRTVHDFSKPYTIEYEKNDKGEYVKDKDGNYKFIEGANNTQYIKRLENILGIANLGEYDDFKGFENKDKQFYIDWGNKVGKEYIDGLISRIKSGNATKADFEAINEIGLLGIEDLFPEKLPVQVTQGYQPNGVNTRDPKREDQEYIYKDNAGNLYITDAFRNFLNQINVNDRPLSGNLMFNDWWREWRNQIKNTQGYDPFYDYDDLYGHTLIGNRLYKTSDLQNPKSELYKRLHDETNWYNFNAQDNYGAADQLVRYLWSHEGEGANEWDSSKRYSPYMNANASGRRYRSLSGNFILPEGYEGIEWWNKDDQRDYYGRPTQYYYDIFDNSGAKYSGISPEEFLNLGYERTNSDSKDVGYDLNAFHKGYYAQEMQDLNGNSTGITVHTNPYTGDMILEYPRLFDQMGEKMAGKHFRIPKELANALFYMQKNNPQAYKSFWNTIANDPKMHSRFRDTLHELIGTGAGDILKDALSVDEYKRLGFDKSTAEALYRAMEAYKKRTNPIYSDRSQAGRTGYWTIDAYQPAIISQKNGGVVKFQKGGLTIKPSSGGGEKEVVVTSRQTQSPTRQAGVGYKDSPGMSNADIAELVALGTDLGSLITSFTGATPVAAGLGAAGSLSSFYGDIDRDGFQWGDLGNLGINLGMDLATLFSGPLGQSAKVAKRLSKAGKTYSALMKLASLYGLGDAFINTVNKIADGESFSISDMRRLINGIQAGTNLYKTGLKSGASKRTITPSEQTFKTGDIEVKINKSEMDKINSKPAKERMEALSELLASKAKAANPNTTITKENVLEELSVPTKNTLTKSWNPLKLRTVVPDVDFKPEVSRVFTPKNRNWFTGLYFGDSPTRIGRNMSMSRNWNDIKNIKSDFVFVTPNIVGSNDQEPPKPPMTFYKKGGKIVKASPGVSEVDNPEAQQNASAGGGGPTQYGGYTIPRQFDWIGKALNISDLINSTIGINRSIKQQKDAVRKGMIGSQRQMPTELYPTFSDNGLNAAYDKRINQMRIYDPNTNDQRVLMAERLMRDQEVDRLEGERDDKFSQMFREFKNTNLGLKQQYADQRRQIADANKNSWYNGLAQLDMLDASKTQQQTQNIKNWLYQERQDHARDIVEEQEASKQMKMYEANVKFENELKTKYGAEYDRADKSDYPSLADYVSRTHPEEYARIRAIHFANVGIDNYNTGYSWWWWRPRLRQVSSNVGVNADPKTITVENTASRKRGGTISKRYRDVDEQRYLDQNKAIDKAINDLNKDIVKLFMKMIS